MTGTYQYQDLVKKDEPPFGAFRPSLLQSLLLKIIAIPPFYRGALRRRSANLIRAFSRTGAVDIMRNNGAYRLRGRANLIEDAVLVHPKYNRRELDFLRDGTPIGGTFIDLGANMGLYTLPLTHKVGPEGRVLAIDANPDIIEALKFNIEASQFKNIDVICVAVGEKEKTVRLEMRKDDVAIVETHEDPNGDVKMLPLMEIVRNHKITQLDSLKADIEGYEDRALIPYLSQASDALKPIRIVIEHAASYDWKTDLHAALIGFGYHLVGKERSNSLYQWGERA